MDRSEGWKFTYNQKKSKLKKPLDKQTLKEMAARGLDKQGMAAEYGVTYTHFCRLLKDRVSLNEGIEEGNKIYGQK